MERNDRYAFSPPIAGKLVRAAFGGGRLTSDAGVRALSSLEETAQQHADRYRSLARRHVH